MLELESLQQCVPYNRVSVLFDFLNQESCDTVRFLRIRYQWGHSALTMKRIHVYLVPFCSTLPDTVFTLEVSGATPELPVPDVPLDVTLVLADFIVVSFTLYLAAKSLQQGIWAKHRPKPVLKDLKWDQELEHELIFLIHLSVGDSRKQ